MQSAGSIEIIALTYGASYYDNAFAAIYDNYDGDVNITEFYSTNWTEIMNQLMSGVFDILLIPFGHYVSNYYTENEFKNGIQEYMEQGGGVIFLGFNYYNYGVFDFL